MTVGTTGKTLDLIMQQIRVAPPSSPIAVFRCGEVGRLEAVYHTFTTQEVLAGRVNDLKTKREGYIGTFHKECDLDSVRVLLETQIVGETA